MSFSVSWNEVFKGLWLFGHVTLRCGDAQNSRRASAGSGEVGDEAGCQEPPTPKTPLGLAIRVGTACSTPTAQLVRALTSLASLALAALILAALAALLTGLAGALVGLSALTVAPASLLAAYRAIVVAAGILVILIFVWHCASP